MTHWYYADADRQTHGPVDQDALVATIMAGTLSDSTQLWQDGWPNWRPLSACRDLLGLAPRGPAQSPPPIPSAAPPPISSARPHPSRPSGLSGRAIALIALAVGGLVLVGVVGMLAAIALPAYQDYVSRSRVSMAIGETLTLRETVASSQDANGTCPDNDTEGFQAPEAYAGTHVASVLIGEFDDETCGMELVLRAEGHARIDGKRLWWARDADGDWTCSSEIEDKLLPHGCRG